jgi:hypothetical protein
MMQTTAITGAEQSQSAREAGTTRAAGIPEPSPPPGRARLRAWGAAAFVWGVWALMLLGLLLFLRTYSVNMPGLDEWHLVPVLTGEQPLTGAWLWDKFTEHRVALTRLTLFGLARLSGCDFRAPIFLNALLLGALAAGMILAAKRLRGRTSYCDAFFPLALLHLAHFDSVGLLQGWCVCNVAVTVLAGVVLLVIVRGRRHLPLPAAVLVGVCLVLLPLYSAPGLIFSFPLALWLGYAGVRSWRSAEPHGRRNGLVTLGLAAAALLMLPLYFVGGPGFSERLGDLPSPDHSLKDTVHGTLVILGGSCGVTPANSYLPFQLLVGVGVLGLLLSCAVFLAVVWWKQPQERLRAPGFLSFLGAAGALALAIGWGRGYMLSRLGDPHYAVLTVLGLCGVYFAAQVYRAGPAGRRVQAGLFVLACLLLIPNVRYGFAAGKSHAALTHALASDLEAGMPAEMLAERHIILNPTWSGRIYPEVKAQMADGLRALRRAQVGVFKHLQEGLAYREVPIPVAPVAVNEMTWQDGTGQAYGSTPSLTFALEKPRQVYAVRLRFSMNEGSPRRGPVTLRLSWKTGEQQDFPSAGQTITHVTLGGQPGGETVPLWINAPIDRFRLHPDEKPCVIHITEIALLVPPAGARGPSGP